ncbi:glycosyltransferase [Streptomyces sp. NPDC090306]|uniref:glycosyltransferase n=1 Tax=Streptomyces sp. NPDC090306 TaxID=3365961 RepID=UPI003802DA0E
MIPRAVAVVVPAHNEEQLLPHALRSVRVAAAHPLLRGVRVLTVVAADACSDATAAVAHDAGTSTITVHERNVGRARAAGVACALELLGGPVGTWIASTDADSTVPHDWLAHHLARAQEGWDAVVGTVTTAVGPGGPSELALRHHALYTASRPPVGPWPHPHVHGANLGVDASAYSAVGGFPPLPLGEDQALVAALRCHGHRVLRTADCPVVTSARLVPRAQGGFGHYLAALAAPSEREGGPEDHSLRDDGVNIAK